MSRISAVFLATALAAACGSGSRTLREGPQEDRAGPSGTLRLRIVTFNVHDLLVADRRPARMRAIGRELGRLAPDWIGLQEAFKSANRDELVKELERVSGVDYHTLYFPSGMYGSGLFVLSRHEIERAVFWRYSKNGAWTQFKHGDWYAGKGVAMTRIRVEGSHIDLFDTHAIANYLNASYREDRTVQMRELAAFVEAEATTAAPAFVLGDLNCRHGQPEFALGTAGLEDLIETIAPDLQGRIDHILVRPHAGYAVQARRFLRLREGKDDAGKPIDLSDHDGYVLDVAIEPRSP
ncbi:MAG: endonuclease/exonuclease/phosphatase family protein [Planctomycetota bacterium]|jgi:endonuclease/exonuclease/phosphatase family metal-dependent hydrolase